MVPLWWQLCQGGMWSKFFFFETYRVIPQIEGRKCANDRNEMPLQDPECLNREKKWISQGLLGKTIRRGMI